MELTDQFELKGRELTLEAAEAIKDRGVALLREQEGGVMVDLKGLEKANSVTVAVMAAWYRAATLSRKTIEFRNLPRELRNIIEFSGLSRVLLRPPGAEPETPQDQMAAAAD